eukprot:TRINITY_DN20389_c0_g1_i1.p1 TRINITY_DN20389_c0_g1~~TRINITY_DN20389_c0_g1_i1.p1  ORF type:complete len:111 (+),score=19.46 TRINITY_DN20389_c0_g1_i1:82-414(+)
MGDLFGDVPKKEASWWQRLCCCCCCTCCEDSGKRKGKNASAAAFQTRSAFDRYKVEAGDDDGPGPSSRPRQGSGEVAGFGDIGDHFIDLCDDAPTPGFLPGRLPADGNQP